MADLTYLTQAEARLLAEYIDWTSNDRHAPLNAAERPAFETLQKIAGISLTFRGR